MCPENKGLKFTHFSNARHIADCEHKNFDVVIEFKKHRGIFFHNGVDALTTLEKKKIGANLLLYDLLLRLRACSSGSRTVLACFHETLQIVVVNLTIS